MQIKSDVTVIMTLYKTPLSKLKNLENYKNFKLILFEQETDGKNLSELKKILEKEGKTFKSQTDTEVITVLLTEKLKNTDPKILCLC